MRARLAGPRRLSPVWAFEGIDAVTNRTIKEILLSLQKRGVTVVLTSHILEVVEQLCPLIAIIDEGKLPCYQFGRVYRLKTEDVDSFLHQARVAPGDLSHLYPEPRGDAADEAEKQDAGEA